LLVNATVSKTAAALLGLALVVIVLAIGFATVFWDTGISRVLSQVGQPSATPVGGYHVGPLRCTDASAPHADDCRRLVAYGQRLLDQASHAPVASVAVYEEPPTGYLRMISGAGDFAIVAFILTDGTVPAFYIRCGAGFDETLCMDLRPLKPGFRPSDVGHDAPMPSNPNPVPVP
jgi:hypothetical protein